MSNFLTAQNFGVLSYSNVWGDLVVTTNKLVQQNNDLASNNFTKSTGTIILKDPTLGLQANTPSIFYNTVQVIGPQGSMQIGQAGPGTGPGFNNLTVYGQTYLSYSNTGPSLTVANGATVNGQLLLNGPFVLNGVTVYSSNVMTLNAGSMYAANSLFSTNRGTAGSNASIRWFETNKYWDINDVNTGIYYRIITQQYVTDLLTAANTSFIASANSTNTLNNFCNSLQSSINTITGNTITSVNANVSGTLALAQSAYNQANIAVSQLFFQGTSGTANSTTYPRGLIILNSNNGVNITGSGNTLTISTPQDLRTNSNVTFNSVNVGNNGIYVTNTGASISGTTPLTNFAYFSTGSYSSQGDGRTYFGYNTGSGYNNYIRGNLTTFDASVNVGTTLISQSLGVGTSAGTTGTIRATGDITAYYSDENLKTKLGVIENALDKIMQISGFYYEANEIAQSMGYEVKREVGVSAQQVNNVMPEVVVPAPIDDKYLTVKYERLVPLLIEAVKELKLEVDQLKKG